MRPMTYDEMQALLTYLMACQANGTAQQALSIRFREMWEQGDVVATKFLATEFRAIAVAL